MRKWGTDIATTGSKYHRLAFFCVQGPAMVVNWKWTTIAPLNESIPAAHSHIADIVADVLTLDIICATDRWLPLLLGQVPAMILPREWETGNFASHPIAPVRMR